MKLTMKKVITYRDWQTRYHDKGSSNRSAAYTRTFTLECGHEVSAKASAGLPGRKHCSECSREKITFASKPGEGEEAG